ncbi:MAG TPA: hypothetical protein VIP77_13120 [Jiangellaceae bacterium]
MTFLIVLLALTALAFAAAGHVWLRDGGPRRPIRPRAEDEWSSDLPNHPYATG